MTAILTGPTDPASEDRHGQVGRCSRPEIESHPSRAIRLAKEVCLDWHSQLLSEMFSGAGSLLVRPRVSIIVNTSAELVHGPCNGMPVKQRRPAILAGRAVHTGRGILPARRMRRRPRRINRLRSRRRIARPLTVGGPGRLLHGI